MVINHRVCIYGSCKKEASYNYKNNKKRLYCKEHKKENMFPIKKLFEYKKIVEDKLNVKYKEDDMQDILHMCIIVSIADVIGNVEIDYKETDEKFIFHDIKKVEDDTHKEPKSAYNKFNYNTGNIPSIVEYLVKSGISAYKNKKKPHSSLTMKK